MIIVILRTKGMTQISNIHATLIALLTNGILIVVLVMLYVEHALALICFIVIHAISLILCCLFQVLIAWNVVVMEKTITIIVRAHKI